jgi:hypothetical protein
MSTLFKALALIGASLAASMAVAQDEERPRTLLGDSNKVTGAYMSISGRYTSVLNSEVLHIGFAGAVVIDHRVGIGIMGTWSTGPIKNDAYRQYLEDNGQANDLSGLELRYGYWGVIVEPVLWHRRAVHLTLPLNIGLGSASYSFPPPGSDGYQRNRTDGQAFFAFEPGLEVELSIVDALRIGFGGSYLYTSDITLPETPADALRTPMARMTIKLGEW